MWEYEDIGTLYTTSYKNYVVIDCDWTAYECGTCDEAVKRATELAEDYSEEDCPSKRAIIIYQPIIKVHTRNGEVCYDKQEVE